MRTSKLVLGLLWSLAGCEGTLRDPFVAPGEGPSEASPDKPAVRKPDGGGHALPEVCAPRAPARVVLLNDFQHVSAVRAMMGADALVGEDLPNRQLKPFAQKGLVVNTSLVHTRWEWGEQAASKLAQAALGCATVDATCARKFLGTFMSRAFRRPLEDGELDDLMQVYTLAAKDSPLHGVQRAIEAVLAAPSFTYRRELGQKQGDARALDAYELASVLSFGLTDAPPDDALWEAATDGKLGDPEHTAEQVQRLLALPDTQDSLAGTLLASWGLGNIFGTAKDPALFPSFNPQLQASMYHETELLVGDVLWKRQAPINELLTTPRTFVDAALAKLYGIDAPKVEFGAVTLPQEQRAGLLTQAGVLAMLARSDTTSVVARGLFVRGLLCMPKVASPPESLSGEISALLMQDLTEKQRADVRAQNKTCAACHTGIDPYGLLLESYDALGRYRTTLKNLPIDTAVTIQGSAAYAGAQPDALAFTRAAASADDFTSCVATRLLSYALQDDALSPKDCQVEDVLAGSDAQTLDMPELAQRVFASPALRQREDQP